MIHIVLTEQNDLIRTVEVSGHSGSAEKGRDLICAAVSTIVFGTGNALDELGSTSEVIVGDNRVTIHAASDEKTQIILRTMEIQLRTVQEGSETFVNIRKTEV